RARREYRARLEQKFFLAEMQRMAATQIQTAIRGVWARRELARLRKEKQEEVRALQLEHARCRAAADLQCFGRQAAATSGPPPPRSQDAEKRTQAATQLQCAVRAFSARRELASLRAEHAHALLCAQAATRLAAWWRGELSRASTFVWRK